MIISVKIVEGMIIEDYESHDNIEIDIPDEVLKMWEAVNGFLVSLCRLEQTKTEREVARQKVLAARAVRQNGPVLPLTEEQKVLTAEWSKDLMKQYVMTLDGVMPRGIVYADSPLRKKDDAD